MRIGRFAFGECSSSTLPPEGDNAISPHSPLRPPRKSFAFALRTAAVLPGRRIGTRECRNVKPLRFRDTALAALDGVCSNYAAAHRYRFATHSFNGWRCCPIPPLFKVLLAEPSRSVLHCEQEIYYHRLLSHIAVHSHYSPGGRADLSPMEHVG